jgi:chromosome segregation ATPase
VTELSPEKKRQMQEDALKRQLDKEQSSLETMQFKRKSAPAESQAAWEEQIAAKQQRIGDLQGRLAPAPAQPSSQKPVSDETIRDFLIHGGFPKTTTPINPDQIPSTAEDMLHQRLDKEQSTLSTLQEKKKSAPAESQPAWDNSIDASQNRIQDLLRRMEGIKHGNTNILDTLGRVINGLEQHSDKITQLNNRINNLDSRANANRWGQ